MTTDTTEKGLERLICTALAGDPCEPSKERSVGESPAVYGGVGWTPGSPHDYDREYCVDLVQLAAFLDATQPKVAEAVSIDAPSETGGPTRRKFLARLQGEISKRGTVDVLRHGIKHGAHDLDLFYGTPSPGNDKARERFEQNRFTVTRQLRYSRDETQRALDVALFINGLPVFTFELKNSLTRLPVARGADPRVSDQRAGELRPDRRDQGREDGAQEAQPGLAPLPPARCGAPAAGGCRRAWGGQALPDSAFRR